MKLVLRFVGLGLLLGLASCSTTTYYIVRHAEKLNESSDPPLSPAGVERAERLADELADKEINCIFVSDRQRTQQTAAPSAEHVHEQPTIVPGGNTDQLIAELTKLSGKQVLVVRHSNEIHLIVNALSPNDPIAPIPDEYDNLFVVRKRVVFGKTSIELKRLKYGKS